MRLGGEAATNSAATSATASSYRISVQQQAKVAEGELALDALTRTLVHDRYEYRFVTTLGGAAAFVLERDLQRGALSAGKPFLNPA